MELLHVDRGACLIGLLAVLSDVRLLAVFVFRVRAPVAVATVTRL